MSQSQGTEPVITEPVVPDEGTGHPAWKEVLDTVPAGLHPMITPALEKWDKNFQEQVAKAKEPYAPWQELVDAQVDPQDVISALNFYRATENDPAAVVKALQEAYGLTKAEAKEVVAAAKEGEPEGSAPVSEDPRIAALQAQLEQLTGVVTSRTQQEDNVLKQQQLRTYLDGIKEKFPLVPEDYLIPRMANGTDGETAAKDFMALLDTQLKAATAPGQEAPIVMGSGGGVPSTREELSKLSDKDRRDLVTKMLQESANAQT